MCYSAGPTMFLRRRLFFFCFIIVSHCVQIIMMEEGKVPIDRRCIVCAEFEWSSGIVRWAAGRVDSSWETRNKCDWFNCLMSHFIDQFNAETRSAVKSSLITSVKPALSWAIRFNIYFARIAFWLKFP